MVDDVKLLYGIHKYGLGAWDLIKDDPEVGVCFWKGRLALSRKEKHASVCCYAHANAVMLLSV